MRTEQECNGLIPSAPHPTMFRQPAKASVLCSNPIAAPQLLPLSCCTYRRKVQRANVLTHSSAAVSHNRSQEGTLETLQQIWPLQFCPSSCTLSTLLACYLHCEQPPFRPPILPQASQKGFLPMVRTLDSALTSALNNVTRVPAFKLTIEDHVVHYAQ